MARITYQLLPRVAAPLGALAAALALLALAACPRQYVAGNDPAVNAKASHPWELGGASASRQSTPAKGGAGSTGMQVELPDQRGPRLSADDTLDESQLPGAWRQVCYVHEEKLQLAGPGQMNLMELKAGGTVTYHLYMTGKEDIREGTWRKVKPGVLDVRIGSPTEMLFYGQLVDGRFLYLWNYDNQEGLWYARQPDSFAERLEHNRFSTTRGELKLTNVVQNQFRGTLVESGTTVEVHGEYEGGLLTMGWSDAVHSSNGFAVFVVSPDSASLHGYWWLNDYEAAPFGGAWDGTAN